MYKDVSQQSKDMTSQDNLYFIGLFSPLLKRMSMHCRLFLPLMILPPILTAVLYGKLRVQLQRPQHSSSLSNLGGMVSNLWTPDLGTTTPCQILIEEAHRQFPDRNQMCVLSIGTGFGDVVGLGNSRLSIIKTLKKMATSSKKVASELDAQYGGSGQYHRFNVDHGLQNVTLSDWEKTSKISAHTYIYLKENERAIEEFVNSFANITGDRQSDKALLTTRNLAAQRTRSKIEEMQPTALNTTLADLHLSRNTPSILVTDSIGELGF